MDYYLFLKEDLKELNKQIKVLEEGIREAEKEKTLATTQSSETWHDNYGFEEGVRRIKMLAHRLCELDEIKIKAKIAEVTPDNYKVSIGKAVTIEDLETKKTKQIKIGSYLILKNNGSISYNSPMGKSLMNAKIGEEKETEVGGKIKKIKIIAIE